MRSEAELEVFCPLGMIKVSQSDSTHTNSKGTGGEHRNDRVIMHPLKMGEPSLLGPRSHAAGEQQGAIGSAGSAQHHIDDLTCIMRIGVRGGGYRPSRMGQRTPLYADKWGGFTYTFATPWPGQSQWDANGTCISRCPDIDKRGSFHDIMMGTFTSSGGSI